MKKTAFVLCCLLAPLQASFAAVDPALHELLSDSSRQADIFAKGSPPFEMEADFVAQLRVPTKGHLTLKWGAPDRYWQQVTIGDFQQTDIRKGESLYILRNGPFTPEPVGRVTHLLRVLDSGEQMEIKKQKNGGNKNANATCLIARHEGGKHEICIDPVSRDILSDEWSGFPDLHGRQEFSQYADFAGRRYPHKITAWVKGSRDIEIEIERLDRKELDEAELTPPPNAIVRRKCEGMQHAIAVKTPDPPYPQSSRENQLSGTSKVSLTILADGTVENVQLIGTATKEMDRATVDTIKQWKFKPAMCGSEPVTSDIEVEMHFSLR